MEALTFFTSTQGRLTRRPFALSVLAIYVTGFATQALLSPAVTARAGLWPFILAQAALIWAWLVVHIKRLRDAGQGPAAAIGVAVVSALSIGLLLMMIAFLTNPNDVGPPAADEPPQSNALSLFFIVIIFGLLFSPDFGAFMMILKLLAFIACLPAIVALIFSIYVGMRPSVAGRDAR